MCVYVCVCARWTASFSHFVVLSRAALRRLEFLYFKAQYTSLSLQPKASYDVNFTFQLSTFMFWMEVFMSDWNLRKHKRSAAIRVSTQENLDSTTAQVTCYIRSLIHIYVMFQKRLSFDSFTFRTLPNRIMFPRRRRSHHRNSKSDTLDGVQMQSKKNNTLPH